MLTTTLTLTTLFTLLSHLSLTSASPTGNPLVPSLKTLSPNQLRALHAIVREAHKRGVATRSILGDIFGDDNDPQGYAPYNVSCPSGINWNRVANSLGTVETDYLSSRKPILESNWQSHTSSSSSVNVTNPSRTPVIALSLSGGGYRAMISGSGQAFLKNETEGSVGDVLGLSSYVGGLSGGSWAISSWLANDGAQPDYLVDNVWNLESNLVVPSDNKLSFYYDLITEVNDKGDVGFQTQITDYWALALSDHLFPEPYRTDQTPNLTITDIRNYSAVTNASLPFPVIIALEREPGELVVPLNSTIWEFTYGEFGSWFWGADTKTEGGFTNMEYLGSALQNGQPVGEGDEPCVLGFSNLGFIAGTSSTLFNQAFLQLNESNSDSIITNAIQEVLGAIGRQENDVAVYPNSFAGWEADTNPIADFQQITLVDGGEANENIPFEPFLVSPRAVDAIIAFDNSADTTYSWPNGSSLWTSYQKGLSQSLTYNITNHMPIVPSTNGFVNGGLNQRPVFFGCNQTDTPIVVYVPNYPWSTYSNATTYQLEYPIESARAIVQNGRRTLDLNGTVADWPTCLTCALVERANNGTRSEACETCMNTWCWDGVDNSTDVTEEYEPVLGIVPSFITNLTGETGGEPQQFTSGSRERRGVRGLASTGTVMAGAGVAAVATGMAALW